MADDRLRGMMRDLGLNNDITTSQHIVKEERWEIPSRYEVTKSVTMMPHRESSVGTSQLSSTTIERRYIVEDQAEAAYRKSFIQALPENMRSEVVKRSQVEKIVTSSEKKNMGGDLELLVLLLSVEVERLNGECESWKFRYTDLDRRISDRQAVEEELRQATVRFNEMKVQYTLILEENERYKVLIGRLQEEIESWKVKYGSIDFSLQSKYEMSEKRVSILMQDIEAWKQKYIALERAKDKEMEELRLTFEARRKSYIEREVRELTLRFQNDRSNYEAELKRYRDLLEMRTRELDDWKTRYSKLEITITDLRGTEVKVREYENRIALLSQEIERLNSVLKSRLEEVETWRLNYNKLEIRVKDLSAYESEVSRLRDLLESRAREIDEWKSRYSKLEIHVTDLRAYEPKLRDYENRIALLTQEIERLNGILRGKNDEIDGWRSKYSKIEITVNEYKAYEVRLKEYENRIALLTQEIERLNGLLRSRGEEIDSWKSRYSKLEITVTELRSYEGRLSEYENRIALLTQEIERLNNILRQRADEIDQWRIRYAKLESTLNDYKVFEGRTKEYEQRIALLLKELDEWKTRYSKLEITLVEYRAYEDRLKEYENRIALLTQEIERLNSVLRQRSEEIDNWKSRYSKIEISITEYKGLEGRLREYENRIALLSQEIERLNGVLKSRADEIEQWRVNYSKLEITINEYKVIESRGKDMENRVSLLLREIDDWKSRYSKLEISIGEYRNLEGRLKEYENRIALLTQEIERLNNVLRMRLEEVESWRSKYSKLEITITELRGYEGRSKEYEQRISALLGEIDNWKSRYSKLELTIVELRSFEGRLKEYENRIALLTQEIERLNNILRSKNGEIEDWRGRYAKLEMSLLEYKDYEKRIRVLSQEIDRLNGIIHENEEELGKWRLKYVEYSSLNNRIQEQLALFVMAFTEIESLRSRVIEKEREVEEVRRSNLAPYRK